MKKTKKLIAPIALLVLAVMAVTSTTLAWFTTNSSVTAKISTITATTNEDMFFIEVDGATDSTPKQQFSTGVETDIKGITTTDPTAADTALFDITYDAANKKFLNKNDSDAAASSYYKITYNFYSTNSGMRVLFDTKTSTLTDATVDSVAKERTLNQTDRNYLNQHKGVSPIETTADKILTEGKYITSAANAARVLFREGDTSDKAIWNPNAGEGYEDADKYAATGSGSDGKIWDVQDIFSKALASSATAPVEYVAKVYSTVPTVGGVRDAAWDTANGIQDTDPEKGTEFIQIATCSTTATNEKESIGYPVLYKASVAVYIWLEGTDTDCFNVILGQAINTAFSFSAKAAA